MTPPSKTSYVTQDECKQRHGTSKTKIGLLAALVLAMLGAPGVAIAIAMSANGMARSNATKIDSQYKMVSEIHEDVREIRADTKQLMRNGRARGTP